MSKQKTSSQLRRLRYFGVKTPELTGMQHGYAARITYEDGVTEEILPSSYAYSLTEAKSFVIAQVYRSSGEMLFFWTSNGEFLSRSPTDQ